LNPVTGNFGATNSDVAAQNRDAYLVFNNSAGGTLNALASLATVDAAPDGYGQGPGRDIATHLAREGVRVEVRNESVTLNPDWDPPGSIAYGELLPRFRRNPRAAAAEGFEAIDAAGQVVAAASVDWNARPFPYRIRQRPGAGNALGFIRFNLPNPFAIYLHDTPNRGLFNRTHRALSHGCVRVKDPVQLGEELFDDPAWNVAALQSAIDTAVMQDIPLATPAPVYFLYLTATARPDGSVLYLDDIYHRDDALVRALDQHLVAIAGDPRPGMCPS
jgi:murein L,D-transpeptidase YcbB/YkuD